MTGIKKVFFSLFVLICFFFFISVILLKIILPSDALKNFAKDFFERKISSFTGGKSEVKSVSVGFNGIALSGVKVFFTDDSEITVKKIIIALNLFPFPRKQFAINKIKIVNPVVKFNLSFAAQDFGSLMKLPAGYTLILNWVTVEDGEVYCPKGKFNISKLNIDVKNASAGNPFPVEIFFNMGTVPCGLSPSSDVSIKSECNFRTQQLLIDAATVQSGRESLLLTGEIKKFLSFKNLNFNVNLKGSGLLFNRVFMPELYKKKITVFEKGDINLNIHGNLEAFQVKNGSR